MYSLPLWHKWIYFSFCMNLLKPNIKVPNTVHKQEDNYSLMKTYTSIIIISASSNGERKNGGWWKYSWSMITVVIKTNFYFDQLYFFYSVGRQFSTESSSLLLLLNEPTNSEPCVSFTGFLPFSRIPLRMRCIFHCDKEGSAHTITRFPQAPSSSTMRSTLLPLSSL